MCTTKQPPLPNNKTQQEKHSTTSNKQIHTIIMVLAGKSEEFETQYFPPFPIINLLLIKYEGL